MIGRKIKHLRLLKDYTQEYVADKIGLTQQAYSSIERNSVDIGICLLLKLAKIFEVDVREIYRELEESI